MFNLFFSFSRQGSRKTLTKDLVWAHDTDTPAEALVFAVLSDDSDVGHLERANVEGQSLRTFTQDELNKGLIDYVHSGKSMN